MKGFIQSEYSEGGGYLFEVNTVNEVHYSALNGQHQGKVGLATRSPHC